QAALRTRLVAELEQAHVSNETERLRSALLSSVSKTVRSAWPGLYLPRRTGAPAARAAAAGRSDGR
ncbi:hypothetical protein C7E13_19530, partial [Stenotrophomonas maltophilia]